MEQKYEVVIVGAGPAGAILAYELARMGIRVLLLEKEILPRYKVCAGGIALRTSSLIPIDIGEVVEDVIYGIRLRYKFEKKILKTYDKPVMYLAMRDRFDYLLTRLAADAGAAVEDGEKVNYIESSSDCVRLKTETKSLSAQILVGADGANSIVARSAGLMTNVDFGICLQGEVNIDRERLEEWKGIVEVNIGDIPGGYGYIFPKKDHISVGVGGRAGIARKLKPYLFRLLESQKFGNYEIWSLKGHLMPSRRKGMPVVNRRVLLVGDAAGLIEAVSGEGIYYAVRSAQMAAPVIARALQTGMPMLQEYERAVDTELMPALETAQRLAKIINWGSRPVFNIVRDNEIVWNSACQVLRGERTYPTFEGVRSVLKLRKKTRPGEIAAPTCS